MTTHEDSTMSHDEFEARMETLRRLVTRVYQAEVDTFYNVSSASAAAIDNAIEALNVACDHMGDDG